MAGPLSKPLIETLDADWDAMMAVNLRGPFLLCRAAVRLMLAQEPLDEVRGRIINITSQHGGDGIMCNAVAPDKIMTGAAGDLTADSDSAAYVRSRTPFSRMDEPPDVAAGPRSGYRRERLAANRQPSGGLRRGAPCPSAGPRPAWTTAASPHPPATLPAS
jgi:NAD(P)-dependent dehydrogenase (short-subunit alcohol dehydrogenase family)